MGEVEFLAYQSSNSKKKVTKPKEASTSRATKGSLKGSAFMLALCACLLSVRSVRWNVALAIYMPLLGGFPFEFTSLQPVYDAWVEFELTYAHTFVNPSGPTVREIQAKDYSLDELMRVSENMRYPVVVRGLFNGSVAHNTFGTQAWSEKHGEFILRESVAKDQYKYEYDVVERGTLKEFLDAIRAGEYRLGYGLDELFVRHNDLVHDLEYSRVMEKGSNACATMALFAGSGGDGLKWHNENHMNIGQQLVGSKTWHFQDPEFIPLLGPDRNTDPYSTGYSFRASKRIHDLLPKSKVTVYPGDATLSTTWLLHRVDSHGDPDSNICLLNTCRLGVEPFNGLGGLAQPVLELFHHLGTINWLDPALPAFVRLIPYFHLVQENIRAMTDTMPVWDDHKCFSSKGRACRNYIEERGWAVNDKNSRSR